MIIIQLIGVFVSCWFGSIIIVRTFGKLDIPAINFIIFALFQKLQKDQQSLVKGSKEELELRQKIINIDGTLTSFETANGYLDAAKMFTAIDTDPSQINVSSNSYLLGNSTIDYVIDSSNVTLLQISNTDISATNNYVITYNNNSQ